MFIDTNIFVSASFETAPEYRRARKILGKILLGTEPVRISNQVIREYIATVTRPQKWAVPMTVRASLQQAEKMQSVCTMLEDNQEVLNYLMKISREVPVVGLQVHDANIVATMLAYGEKRLLTFDNGFYRYSQMIDLVNIED